MIGISCQESPHRERSCHPIIGMVKMDTKPVAVIVILFISLAGCLDIIDEKSDAGDDEDRTTLRCEPVVVVTGKNYTSDPNSVPYNQIHEKFRDRYNGSDLSISLRSAVIESMKEKAENLSEDPELLEACVMETYTDPEERPRRIPCYAEKATYKNESIWAIAFNRANGFSEGSLGHHDLFFVSIATMETKMHDGCNGTAIVHRWGCE